MEKPVSILGVDDAVAALHEALALAIEHPSVLAVWT